MQRLPCFRTEMAVAHSEVRLVLVEPPQPNPLHIGKSTTTMERERKGAVAGGDAATMPLTASVLRGS
jgi:hypothetical protein